MERGFLGHLGKEGFFMKGKSNIRNMWWLKLAYFNPALPFYENHFIDLLHKSVDRFLCNGKTDKVYL